MTGDPVIDSGILLGDPPAGGGASVSPTVSADIAADEVGAPRPPSKDLTPPGTDKELWYQRSAFKMLIGSLALIWLPLLHTFISGIHIERVAYADAVEKSINDVLVWLGVLAMDRRGLRAK